MTADDKEKKKYYNILLLGCDVQEGIAEINNPTEKQKCMRSDAMVVASINRENRKIKLVSIMRDTWVDIPGYGKGKINSAIVSGGPKLAVKVVNDNFGLNIKKYIAVSLNNMIELIDMIDGIDLELTYHDMRFIDDMMDDLKSITHRYDEVVPLQTEGMKHLNGMQAVNHARDRLFGYVIGRENRINNIIKAIVNKVKNELSFSDIVRLTMVALLYVRTNIGIFNALYLISFGLKADLTDIDTYHAPEEGTYEVKQDRTWRLEVDFPKASEKLWDFLRK